jgi:ribonuclease J
MRNFGLRKGDSLIYSALQIPGNESRIRFLLNKCVEKGVGIYKNSQELTVHTTGHAYKEELRSVIKELKPKYFLPVHGDLSMLKAHQLIGISELGEEVCFCIKNLQSLHISADAKATVYSIKEDLPLSWAKYEYSGSVDDESIREKKKIAREGMVHIVYDEASLFDGKLKLRVSVFACQYLESDWDEEAFKEQLLKDFYKEYDAKKIEIQDWLRIYVRTRMKKRYAMRPLIRVSKI